MSENVHTRALQLVAKGRVEGLAQLESEWLAAHLQECEFCNEHARQTDRALRSLRTAAIPLPADLAGRTQFRVRLRAMELRERQPQRRMQWLACAAFSSRLVSLRDIEGKPLRKNAYNAA